jgi:PAS domain S-box-containing protein
MPSSNLSPEAKKPKPARLSLRVLGAVQLNRVSDRKSERLSIQPKRAALLAYLALHCVDGPCPRELLLPLFWPEVSEARARGALRKAIHELRSVLGDDVIKSSGSDQLSISFDSFDCDASQFNALLSTGAVLAAVSIYSGDFFSGYIPQDAPLERWISKQRELLRARAYGATVLLATDEKRKGSWEPALFWARRAEDLASDPEEAARLVMAILERSGNRAAALSRYASLTAQLSDEYEIGPSPETQALAAKLRTPIRSLPTVTEPVAAGSDFFKDLVEQAYDVIYCTDARGFFTYGNPAGARILGAAREELIGRLYLDFVRPEYRTAMLEFYLRQVQQRIPVTYYEFPVLRKDGKPMWLGQNVQLIEENGKPIGLMAIARDITATRVRQQLEEAEKRAGKAAS